jgi:hypothetical protein
MAGERSTTARGIAALPLLVMGLIHVTVTPLREMFEVEPFLMYFFYAGALGVGVFLWRRSSEVKDHEYHRSKVMKQMKKVYQAEEDGVWQSNAALASELSPEAQLKLKGQVASIDSEAPEMTIGEDERVDVTMLMDAKHIMQANKRVTGANTFGEEGIESTIGAVRKKSPMDSLLDSMFGLFGRSDAAERRLRRKQARLGAAAAAAPVTAQRPVAPIRSTTKAAEESTLKVTSMSDTGGIDSTVSASGVAIANTGALSEVDKVYAWDTTAPSNQQGSIEDMAMLSSPVRTAAPLVQQSVPSTPVCKGCKNPVAGDERFCPHCGLDL